MQWRPCARPDSRQPVLSLILKIGVDFRLEFWIFKSHVRSGCLTRVRIRWPDTSKFCRANSVAMLSQAVLQQAPSLRVERLENHSELLFLDMPPKRGKAAGAAVPKVPVPNVDPVPKVDPVPEVPVPKVDPVPKDKSAVPPRKEPTLTDIFKHRTRSVDAAVCRSTLCRSLWRLVYPPSGPRHPSTDSPAPVFQWFWILVIGVFGNLGSSTGSYRPTT